MSKNDLSQVLERVHSWPEKGLEDAAHVLLEMEAQDASPYRLTDEQLAEIKRRRAKDDVGAATNLIDGIFETERLTVPELTHMGRIGRDPTRQLGQGRDT